MWFDVILNLNTVSIFAKSHDPLSLLVHKPHTFASFRVQHVEPRILGEPKVSGPVVGHAL